MVSGLLSGRGAKKGYDFQAVIKIARSKEQCLTGIILDLRNS